MPRVFHVLLKITLNSREYLWDAREGKFWSEILVVCLDDMNLDLDLDLDLRANPLFGLKELDLDLAQIHFRVQIHGFEKPSQTQEFRNFSLSRTLFLSGLSVSLFLYTSFWEARF